jgi:hypothetical protein
MPMMVKAHRWPAGCPWTAESRGLVALEFSFVRSRVMVERHICDVDVVQVIAAKGVTLKCFIRKQTRDESGAFTVIWRTTAFADFPSASSTRTTEMDTSGFLTRRPQSWNQSFSCIFRQTGQCSFELHYRFVLSLTPPRRRAHQARKTGFAQF